MSIPAKVLVLAVLISSLSALSGCDVGPMDIRQQRINICSDCPPWQQQLGEASSQLSAEEQRLLSNYSERLLYQLNSPPSSRSNTINNTAKSAKLSKKSINILVAKALIEQRRFERLHPTMPTGRPLTLEQRYPITALTIPSIKTFNDKGEKLGDEFLYPQHWELLLTNLGEQPITSFTGKIQLSMTAEPSNLSRSGTTKQPIVTSTQFVPPIQPLQAGTFIVDVPKAIVNQLTPEYLASPAKLSFEIIDAEIVLKNGKLVTLGNKASKQRHSNSNPNH